MTRITLKLAVAAALIAPAGAQQLAPAPPAHPEPPPAIKLIEPLPAVRDWPSYNYDRERTGWNRGETQLNKKTVAKLRPIWNRQLLTDAPALVLSTLTAPVVAGGVSTPSGAKDLVFTIGMDDTLTAMDANSGAIVWQKHFENTIKPLRPGRSAAPILSRRRPPSIRPRPSSISPPATESCVLPSWATAPKP